MGKAKELWLFIFPTKNGVPRSDQEIPNCMIVVELPEIKKNRDSRIGHGHAWGSLYDVPSLISGAHGFGSDANLCVWIVASDHFLVIFL